MASESVYALKPSSFVLSLELKSPAVEVVDRGRTNPVPFVLVTVRVAAT